MKKHLATLVLAVLVGTLGFAASSVAVAGVHDTSFATNDGVCSGTHLPGDGDSSVTYTAPGGFLVSAYCVKAGSVNQGNGPEYHTVSPPQKTVTITHSSGKDVSHYSVTLVEENEETTTTTETETEPTTPTETTPTTPTQTTPTETTPTETTPTETTPAETTPGDTTPQGGAVPTGTEPSTEPSSSPAPESTPTIVGLPPVAPAAKKQAAAKEQAGAVDAAADAPKPTQQAQQAPLTP